MTAIGIYAVCLTLGWYANKKFTSFHPVGWAGVSLLVPAILCKVLL
jgi:hypothetical protein